MAASVGSSGPTAGCDPGFEAIDLEIIAAWNEKAESLVGWGEGDVLGKSVRDLLIAPAERDAYAEWARRARAGPIDCPLQEFTALHRDGRQFPALFKLLARTPSAQGVRCRLSLRALGEQIHTQVGVGEDVTELERVQESLRRAQDELERRVAERTLELSATNERLRSENADRKRIEAALHNEKEFLTAVLNNMDDGIVACDANGTITLFNRATREFHGLTAAPLPPEEWAQYYSLYRADGKTPMATEEIPLFRAFQGETVRNVDLVIAPKNGPVRRVLSSGQAIFDAQGRKLGAIVSMHDVTKQRLAEEELRRHQFLLQYIVNFVPLAIFWKDREDRLLGGNKNFLTNALGVTSIEQMIGKDDYDFFPREQAEYFRKCDFHVMESGEPLLNIEEPQSQWQLGKRILLTSKVPLRDESGAIVGLLGSFVDITERKRMEEELAEAKSAAEAAAEVKSQFLTTVSHELRTPLSLILGPLASLLSSPDEPLSPRARADLERVQRNARRLHRLVDDVLDHQKIEAGKMSVDWDAVDAVQLCADMVDAAVCSAEQGGVELSMQADPGLAAVPLDRRKFEKIVLNLLGNALKFTPPGGRIVVGLRALGDALELSVEDTGPGIPAEKMHLLFRRFQQIDASATRKHEGTGIGLSLVKELTELMGGTVGVTSEVGRGSRFFVRLPRAPDHVLAPAPSRAPRRPASEGYFGDSAPRAAVATNGTSPALGRASRLLVAEDNPDMGAYLLEILTPEWEVELTTNGREALAAAEARRPEVIVSDVMMPEMDGFELTARLKRDPGLRDIPIILLTARAARAEAVGGLEAGADDYLGKPFDPAELKARVCAAERLHRLYVELAGKNHELSDALRRLSETQAELIQAGKMAAVGTLIAGLSHELNNPIAAILMNAQLLLRRQGALDEAALRKAMAIIEAHAKRCSGLVRTLLEYSRKKPAAREPCDVRAALDRAIALSAPQARERMVRLDAQYHAAALPAVLVSLTQLDSALLNVIGNALDAAGDGDVVIEARPLAKGGISGVEIEVRDTGCGIDAEHLGRVFEPFFTTKDPGRGTGLGLSLTRRFFEEHHGDIRIESERGVGTKVFMWLPTPTGEGPREAERGP
ncbi:MAG: ATP-binding protein [Minicystis sp.]